MVRLDVAIGKMDFDSRKMEINDVFVAIRGSRFLMVTIIFEKAIALGAVAVVCDSFPDNDYENGVTYTPRLKTPTKRISVSWRLTILRILLKDLRLSWHNRH